MTRLSFKERAKQRRAHEILEEARRLVRERGYADLNMDTLAEAVGVSKPTLYQHFRSKEDLVAQVLVTCLHELEDDLHQTGAAEPVDQLRGLLRRVLRERYLTSGLLADFETETVFTMLHSHPDVIAAKKRLMAEVDQVVEAGKARGEICASFQTPLVGCLLFKLFGLPSTVQALASDPPGSPQDMADLIESIVMLFTRSIAQSSI